MVSPHQCQTLMIFWIHLFRTHVNDRWTDHDLSLELFVECHVWLCISTVAVFLFVRRRSGKLHGKSKTHTHITITFWIRTQMKMSSLIILLLSVELGFMKDSSFFFFFVDGWNDNNHWKPTHNTSGGVGFELSSWYPTYQFRQFYHWSWTCGRYQLFLIV